MKKVSIVLGLLVPSLAFAQQGNGMSTITDANSLTAKLVGIGNTIIYLLISLAIIYIIWNIVQYFIKGSEDEGTRKKAGAGILWGIVGLAIILSIWGLVNILTNTFKTTPTSNAVPNLGTATQTGGIPMNGGIPTIQ